MYFSLYSYVMCALLCVCDVISSRLLLLLLLLLLSLQTYVEVISENGTRCCCCVWMIGYYSQHYYYYCIRTRSTCIFVSNKKKPKMSQQQPHTTPAPHTYFSTIYFSCCAVLYTFLPQTNCKTNEYTISLRVVFSAKKKPPVKYTK